jgi:hypothetical protein
LSLNLNRVASAALGIGCVAKAYQLKGADAAIGVAVAVAVVVAMIWFSRVVAAGMPRRGSSMLGTPDAHHVEPMVFTLLGWGLLLFIAWVLFGNR